MCIILCTKFPINIANFIPTDTAKTIKIAQNTTENQNAFDYRVKFGKQASINQFPYQISLLYHGHHRCGGSIITPDRILTAAHCVTKRQFQRPARFFHVLAGTIIREDLKNIVAVLRKVKRILVHPMHEQNRYDYALVFLLKPLYDQATNDIAQIALASSKPTSGTICVVSGWGETERQESSEVLRYAEVRIVPDIQCAGFYGMVSMPSEQICAHGPRYGPISGPGDSGGPLVCNNTLVGVVSYGPRNQWSSAPGVYASVAAEYVWIQNGSNSPLRAGPNGRTIWKLASVVRVCIVLMSHNFIEELYFCA